MRKLKVQELTRLSIEEFKETKKNPIVLILDNVRSAHNVGSTFRTSDAFLIQKIFLTGITARPPHKEIQKTALGATDSVDWEYCQETGVAVEKCRQEGFQIVSVEQVDNSVSLKEFSPEKNSKYCFVFGNEVFGVGDQVVSHSDFCIEIPQFGTKHSLNISVTVGMVVWDYVSKMA